MVRNPLNEEPMHAVDQWSQAQLAWGPLEAVPGCYRAAHGRCKRECELKFCSQNGCGSET